MGSEWWQGRCRIDLAGFPAGMERRKIGAAFRKSVFQWPILQRNGLRVQKAGVVVRSPGEEVRPRRGAMSASSGAGATSHFDNKAFGGLPICRAQRFVDLCEAAGREKTVHDLGGDGFLRPGRGIFCLKQFHDFHGVRPDIKGVGQQFVVSALFREFLRQDTVEFESDGSR